MTDSRKLAALLRLFDDDSPAVREAVLDAFMAEGEGLTAALARLPEPPDEGTVRRLDEALAARRGVEAPVGDADGDAPTATADDAHASEAAPRRAARAARPVPTLYEPGQLVRHKRYGYRGVVVARDDRFRLSEAWYRSNRTQPRRDQPWYHVLVHQGRHVTYAAQSSLLPDESLKAVDHPLVRFFFSGFEEGSYERNGRVWPADGRALGGGEGGSEAEGGA